jgi:hypothetical protein
MRLLSERDDRLDLNVMSTKLEKLSQTKLNQVGDTILMYACHVFNT